MLAPMLAFAQPVIQDGSTMPAPGFTVPVSVGSATTGIGGAGAAQTWDFRSVGLVPVGNVTIVAPASTPFSSSYAASNYAFTLTTVTGGTQYFYLINSAGRFETLAAGVTTGPGSGDDYTPNPLTTLAFPFSFGETVTDTYQKVGGNIDNVVLTYDGYGTLMMPYGTYTDVVRVRLAYPGGSDYVWYSSNPLTPLLAFGYGNNLFTAFAAPVSSVGSQAKESADRSVISEPVSGAVTISISGADLGRGTTFLLCNVAGETVRRLRLESTRTSIDLDDLAPGVYVYRLAAGGITLGVGTILGR
jgi:hypothetical protein